MVENNGFFLKKVVAYSALFATVPHPANRRGGCPKTRDRAIKNNFDK
jgi:hypothetical protein